MLKSLGIVNTPKGAMVLKSKLTPIDKSKLTDNKKYVKPEKPEVKQLNKEIKEQAKQKPRLTVSQKNHNEARGIY